MPRGQIIRPTSAWMLHSSSVVVVTGATEVIRCVAVGLVVEATGSSVSSVSIEPEYDSVTGTVVSVERWVIETRVAVALVTQGSAVAVIAPPPQPQHACVGVRPPAPGTCMNCSQSPSESMKSQLGASAPSPSCHGVPSAARRSTQCKPTVVGAIVVGSPPIVGPSPDATPSSSGCWPEPGTSEGASWPLTT